MNNLSNNIVKGSNVKFHYCDDIYEILFISHDAWINIKIFNNYNSWITFKKLGWLHFDLCPPSLMINSLKNRVFWEESEDFTPSAQDNSDTIQPADFWPGSIILWSIVLDLPSTDIQFSSKSSILAYRGLTGNGYFTMRPGMLFALFGPIMVFYTLIYFALPANVHI